MGTAVKRVAKEFSGAGELAKRDRRNKIVIEHLPLVKAIAARIRQSLPMHVEVDDLVHAGILGLFDAAGKFDPNKQVVFSSYAKHRIKGAILDSLRQLDWASRDMRRRHKQVEAATQELAETLQRAPTEQEVAEKLGMGVDRFRTIMIDLRNTGLISSSTRSEGSEDLPAPDFPDKPETQPDHMAAQQQLRDVLSQALKTLPERYQKVVILYHINEMTMKEIGRIVGINESRVSQIHKSALEKMQTHLAANGITGSNSLSGGQSMAKDLLKDGAAEIITATQSKPKRSKIVEALAKASQAEMTNRLVEFHKSPDGERCAVVGPNSPSLIGKLLALANGSGKELSGNVKHIWIYNSNKDAQKLAYYRYARTKQKNPRATIFFHDPQSQKIEAVLIVSSRLLDTVKTELKFEAINIAQPETPRTFNGASSPLTAQAG